MGLEPTVSDVTGRRFNQLSYISFCRINLQDLVCYNIPNNFKMSKTNLATLNKVSLLAYLINLGISVPHYCYHNNLSIAGNCRICIVEMGNLNKPVVSCAVSAGTSLFNHEIYHNSGLVKKARENVLEFLLLNLFVIKVVSVTFKISRYFLALLKEDFINLKELFLIKI
jgi:hypothetical protein